MVLEISVVRRLCNPDRKAFGVTVDLLDNFIHRP